MVSHPLIDLDGTLVKQSRFLKSQFLYYSAMALKGECRPHHVWLTSIAIMKALHNTEGHDTIQHQIEQIFTQRTGLDVKHYEEMCEFSISRCANKHLLPGAKSFLMWAKERYKLILATNPIFNRKLTEERLIAAGIQPSWFDGMTTSDSFHYIKPRKEYFFEILDKYRLHPDRCIMIGNDPKKDLPAVDCGIAFYMLAKKPRQRVAPTFKNLYKLKEWMEKTDDETSCHNRT